MNQNWSMDIVERLRKYVRQDDWPRGTVDVFAKAADEIERLRQRVEELERETDIAHGINSKLRDLLRRGGWEDERVREFQQRFAEEFTDGT
jgi:hypothetical protein